MPLIKSIIKKIYININAIIYKNKFTYKILDDRIDKINIIDFKEVKSEETFFGYYDKCPENKVGDILGYSTSYSTKKLPNPNFPIQIFYKHNGINSLILKSSSYNWQQGCRLQWIDDEHVLFNVFNPHNNNYQAINYSISSRSIIKRYDKPVQESFHSSYFLSVNYNRIFAMRPDYGYRNLPKMTKKQLKDWDNDGIWKVDIKSGEITLLHSLRTIIECNYQIYFQNCNHNVNHLMCSPDGKHFIFLHRIYNGKKKRDRLIISDFKQIKILSDEGLFSHCCSIDNKIIFAYMRYNDTDGFFFLNTLTGKSQYCNKVNGLNSGDGHPNYKTNFIVFDTYPDKSRMQTLYLYDIKNDTVLPLLELYHNTKYHDQCRCDLHPRFSQNGGKIYFDSVYAEKRKLCFIDITKIIC